MNLDRLSASLAALSVLATLAITACDRTNNANNDPQAPRTVGQKLDAAVDRTQQKIAAAGDRASQQLSEAGDKTMEKLSQAGQKTEAALSSAGEKIAEKTHEAVTAVKSSTGTTEVTAGTASGDAAAQPAQPSRVNDAAITASIKTDFLKDPDLSVLKIDVDTKGGVVTLNGLAADEPARQRAEKMAGAVKGVREVRNFLVVKRA
jgi:hyperosmotically inducible periplasmic protein